MIKIGIIGFSPANGHPYSFSSIINGFNREAFLKTEWLGILNYLEKRESNEIAALDARVTHVWTQDPKLSKEIANCSYVDNIVEDFQAMIGKVDAVIIARDDYKTHKEFAQPFLEAGIPVFIDKPLTLSRQELKWFKPYYEQGLVMSCSGLRFCKELDSTRETLQEFGEVRLIRTAIINGWEKYGIHMLDATLGIWDKDVTHLRYIRNNSYDTFFLDFIDGLTVQIDTLGSDVVTFSYEVFATNRCEKVEIRDNFSSFKRTLELFVNQVKTKQPSIPWESLNRSISILIAGSEAKKSNINRVKVNYE